MATAAKRMIHRVAQHPVSGSGSQIPLSGFLLSDIRLLWTASAADGGSLYSCAWSTGFGARISCMAGLCSAAAKAGSFFIAAKSLYPSSFALRR